MPDWTVLHTFRMGKEVWFRNELEVIKMMLRIKSTIFRDPAYLTCPETHFIEDNNGPQDRYMKGGPDVIFSGSHPGIREGKISTSCMPAQPKGKGLSLLLIDGFQVSRTVPGTQYELNKYSLDK